MFLFKMNHDWKGGVGGGGGGGLLENAYIWLWGGREIGYGDTSNEKNLIRLLHTFQTNF